MVKTNSYKKPEFKPDINAKLPRGTPRKNPLHCRVVQSFTIDPDRLVWLAKLAQATAKSTGRKCSLSQALEISLPPME